MGVYNFDPGQQYQFDSWGWSPRNDWEKFSHQGRDAWHMRGETNSADEGWADPSTLFGSADAAWAQYGRNRPTPAPGVNQSENAYNASLDQMGIPQEELPFGQYGQEMTARVMHRHGQQMPEYLRPWWPYDDAPAQSNWANPGDPNGTDPGGGTEPDPRRPQAAQPRGNPYTQPVSPYNWGGVGQQSLNPDVFLNTVATNTRKRMDTDKIRHVRSTLRRALLDYVG